MRRAIVFLSGLVLGGALAAAGEGGGGIEVGGEIVICADGPGKAARATPAVAFGNDVFLAVWREGWDGRGGGARVYAARVDSDGKVLDPKGIEVARSEKGVQSWPRVAFGGGVFLVVWQDFRNGKDHDVLAARVSARGKVLDRRPIAVAAAPRSQVLPDVASDGKAFLVVWQGMNAGDTGFRGFAARVSAGGGVGAAVETGATPQPKVAWGGTSYLAAYGVKDVLSVMLSPAGKPLNPSRWGNRTVRGSKGAALSVSGAPGKGWLVIGHRSPPDPWGWGGPGAMRCAFVKPDGRVDNPTLKEPSGNWGKLQNWLDVGGKKKPGATWPFGESASAWDGTHFVAVWPRHHLGGEKRCTFQNCDLFASRVDGWKPLDAAGVPVAASPDEEKHPALASDGAGKLLCVYERHGNDGTVRVAARLVTTQ